MSGDRTGEARAAVAAVAAEFAGAARQVLRGALDRAVEGLVVRHADWFNRLDRRSAAALREAVAEGIGRSADEVARRLEDPDLWLTPSVVVGDGPAPELDNPANRVWIALLNAADRLDPILLEFGLKPSDVPDRGGGHYGLQPQRLDELDAGGGRLAALWGRYHRLYEAYRRAVDDLERRGRDEARRRWNEPT